MVMPSMHHPSKNHSIAPVTILHLEPHTLPQLPISWNLTAGISMGSSQSQDRSTYFQHPEDDQTSAEQVDNDREDEAHCISISNKMVERLVEDATLSGSAAPKVVGPRNGYKDQMHMEKIRCLDENHSERCGLTQADMYTMMQRIAKRTENMVSSETVCAQCKEDIIACYSLAGAERNEHACWEAVEAFKRCVHEAAARRLRARTQRDARELAWRSRHVAHARENVLKDLHAPDDVPCM